MMSEQEKEEFRLLWHQARFGGCGTTLAIFVIVLLLLTSCKTIQYVPVETVRTEYKTNYVHDSVFVETEKNDCTVIETRHDTVFQTRWKTLYKDRWREKVINDTIIERDSIQVPVPVERKLSKWEQFCLDYGKVTTGATLILFIAVILFIIKRIRQKVG